MSGDVQPSTPNEHADRLFDSDRRTIRAQAARIAELTERLDEEVELRLAVESKVVSERAEVRRMRDVADEQHRKFMDAAVREHAWMTGVADAVEPYGYNREAACGPSDLLPGLASLRADAAIGKQLYEALGALDDATPGGIMLLTWVAKETLAVVGAAIDAWEYAHPSDADRAPLAAAEHQQEAGQ